MALELVRLCFAFHASAIVQPDIHLRARACQMGPPEGWEPPPPPAEGDFVDASCRWLNNAMEQTVVPPLRKYTQVRQSGEPQGDFWSTVTSPPQVPGLSRPVWLTIAASVPTALGWYGWYKFSVEEELFYDELRREGRTSGAGGYGTLILFSWLVLLGGLGSIAGVPGADKLIDAGAIWILAGQVNLYRRVNELLEEQPGGSAPLHAWWAVLPPPLDVVVGLRQVHFLARYWSEVRGETWQTDKVAEELFPFISSPRFTLREFARTPSMWFWFTKEMEDLDWPILADPTMPAARADRGGKTRD
jgi:hypothetical protein